LREDICHATLTKGDIQMTTRTTRGRVRAAAIALGGIAAIATTACAASTSATAATRQQPLAVTATAAGVPVVVDCAAHGQTRPGEYILACADGNASLAGLRWAAWGSSAAFADGTSSFNDCVPSCVAGHGHSFPVLVALWRPEPLPGHAGERYFTRLTIIYTGNRTYHAGGKLYHLPATTTDPLSPYGGA
jgi:hypothetical protein